MPRLTLPLKWHGGKYYLAHRIVDLMRSHIHYVEPFCGGCAVLLAHTGEGRSELINDLDGRLMDFWRVLQNPNQFAALLRRLEAVPLSRIEWTEAAAALHKGDEIDQAAGFFIWCRQSLAGRRRSFTPPTRTRLRRGMNGNVSEWLGSIEGLPAVHARLRRVFIESMDAIALIRREDSPGGGTVRSVPSFGRVPTSCPQRAERRATLTRKKPKALPVITSCDACGACCSYMGYPPFNWRPDEPITEYTEPPPEWFKAELVKLREANPRGEGPCAWLENGKCKHYDERPTACREFEMGGEDCLRVRAEFLPKPQLSEQGLARPRA